MNASSDTEKNKRPCSWAAGDVFVVFVATFHGQENEGVVKILTRILTGGKSGKLRILTDLSLPSFYVGICSFVGCQGLLPRLHLAYTKSLHTLLGPQDMLYSGQAYNTYRPMHCISLAWLLYLPESRVPDTDPHHHHHHHHHHQDHQALFVGSFATHDKQSVTRPTSLYSALMASAACFWDG